MNIRLKKSVNDSILNNTKIAILFLDLDEFKLINDTMGHSSGNEVLKIISKRLKSILREDDIVFRVGGDEFIILLEDLREVETIQNVCYRVIEMFKKKLIISDILIYVKTSIGISIFPDDSENIDEIIENSDIAMYNAKKDTKTNFKYYNASMREGMDEDLYLNNALFKDENFENFKIFFQPQINSSSEEICGVEALIRWQHPNRGMIYPNEFIHLCEKNGLIIPMGEWIIREVFKQLKDWKELVQADFKIGINLSLNQLMDPNFSNKVKEILDEITIPTNMIEFEITENVFANEIGGVKENLTNLRMMGFSIALDDFGTKYSSFKYLKSYPLDRIKIPREFISGIGKYNEDESIVITIITLANAIGCDIIAEGVENYKEIEFLRNNACNIIQGYYYYKPMTVDAIESTFFKRKATEKLSQISN